MRCVQHMVSRWLPCADVSENAARGFAEGYGIAAFTSVADLIDSGACDAVHILTPPHLHHSLAIQCLQGGLHVLVEKPVAESAQETREIEAAAQEAGRRFHARAQFSGHASLCPFEEDDAERRFGQSLGR